MGRFNGSVLFVIIWWTVLFAILPLGTRPIAEPDSASGWRGAPAAPRMWRKLMLTTLISAVIWGGCALVITSGLVDFRHGWFAVPQD